MSSVVSAGFPVMVRVEALNSKFTKKKRPFFVNLVLYTCLMCA